MVISSTDGFMDRRQILLLILSKFMQLINFYFPWNNQKTTLNFLGASPLKWSHTQTVKNLFECVWRFCMIGT